MYADVNAANDGYKSTPEVRITSSAGSGATAEASMTGYVDAINLDAMGSGYTCTPDVVISKDDAKIVAKAEATMTAFNPLHSIVLTNEYDAKFEDVPDVLIYTDGAISEDGTKLTGSGATAVVKLSSNGSIREGTNGIILENQGSGYTEAPSVRIISDSGTGAVAQTILDETDGSISIDVLEGGSGYDTDPTIEISLPPSGGVAPVVQDVVIEKSIESITLTNPGEGYNLSEAVADGEYDDEPYIYIGFNIDPDTDTPLDDDEILVRPDMKVADLALVAYSSVTGGEGYLKAPTVTIVPSCGYGSGAVASTEVLLKVDKVVAVDYGSGYTSIDEIVVTIVTPPDGCKTQATTSVLTLGNGSLTKVDVTKDGEGYVAPPFVALVIDYDSGDPNDTIQLQAVVTGGMLSQITFDGVEIPALTIDDDVSIIIRTEVEPATFDNGVYTQSGKISKVLIDKAGAGYVAAPMVKFLRVKPADGYTVIDYADEDSYVVIEDGAFIPAEADAVLADGRIVEIKITNPGTGYYYEPIIEIKVMDEIALAKGTVDIEDGFITGVTIAVGDEGAGYETAPAVTFYEAVPGMGDEATGIAIVKDGEIVDVVMTNYGSGYNGKNTPSEKQPSSLDAADADDSNAKFKVYAGKSYVRDIYLGTGKRSVECETP